LLGGVALPGVTLPLVGLLAWPAHAAPLPAVATHTVTVPDIAEAWYSNEPIDLCTTPLGCPPDEVPTSPYPPDTLHIGVAGGQETSRTYLLPDLTRIPYGASVISATMTLPVAAGSTDGTQSPDSAHVLACVATKPFADGAQGSTAAPPKTDCSTSAKTAYNGRKGVLVLDATALLATGPTGLPPLGIALLPDPKSAQPTDAWHVALNGYKRKNVPHVQTVITYSAPPALPPADPTGGADVPPAPDAPSGGAALPPPPAPTGDLPPPATTSGADTPPVVAGNQPPTTTAQQPAAFTAGIPQPLAFVVPLVLLAGAVFFARVFTRDATPRTPRP
jgi:hypothetical protein